MLCWFPKQKALTTQELTSQLHGFLQLALMGLSGDQGPAGDTTVQLRSMPPVPHAPPPSPSLILFKNKK